VQQISRENNSNKASRAGFIPSFQVLQEKQKAHQYKNKKATFFFLTGLRILITQRSLLLTFMPSNTSLYFPLPTFRTTS
jgi:hypothetical protein